MGLYIPAKSITLEIEEYIGLTLENNFNQFFPIRYLGVPLVDTKLSTSDCKALVDKISGRIGSWTSKNFFC
jgi:hypothetical protein